jgi:hypothetical protein
MSTLPIKEIRNRAYTFVTEWQDETREHAEAKSFWDDFFQVFGVHRRRIASFEQPVKKATGKQGFVDLLWKSKLLVEHKSTGKDLDKAYSQALDYFPGLKDDELPRYVLVSDFARFVLHDLDTGTCEPFDLSALPDNIHLFDFIAGNEDIEQTYQTYELDLKASDLLGKLHDALLESGYDGHPLEVFLVRILFCLFAEDTGIFKRYQFVRYLLYRTTEDGNDTTMHLGQLFQVLDTPEAKRSKHLSEELAAFPYVNGQLFAERLDLPSFDAEMRGQVIDSAWFDWSSISPAIFGSLFQHIMGDSKARRKLGAHYTSEKHILRLINPLFLDELYAEFEKLQTLKRDKRKKLAAFQKKLSALYFFDPACGCGNFLIVTYQALRRLELQVLREQHKNTKDTHLNFEIEPLISLDHFYGIELEEWPMRIAEVAMWLTQHQMNREFAQQFGREPDLLPLKTSAQITCGNALQLDWRRVVDVSKFKQIEALYLLGNPPFSGSKYQTTQQKQELVSLFKNIPNSKQLDYVCCWFYKAAQFIQAHDIKQKVAFVSTNSISQGEQVAPLWKTLFNQGIHIHFAHRTFAWDSEAKGKAAVHVVIVGFGLSQPEKPRLFDYPDVKGEPVEIPVKVISPYLVNAPEVVIESRNNPLSDIPPMWFGNMPLDGGHLLLSTSEKEELVRKEPNAVKWIRPLLGAREFLNNEERWCLWLVGISPKELRTMPEVLKRVENVKQFRLASKAASTRIHAERPTEFRDTRLPENYILVPKVSSERREYVPMGFLDERTISTDLNFMIPNATLYEFGILESKLHTLWLKTVGGRLKSDYRYSAKLVYNNFPFPEATPKQKQAIETAAQTVLECRENYPDSSLADLYDPLAMPTDLRKAHQKLDTVVEKAYRPKKFTTDQARISFLFQRYLELTDPDMAQACLALWEE